MILTRLPTGTPVTVWIDSKVSIAHSSSPLYRVTGLPDWPDEEVPLVLRHRLSPSKVSSQTLRASGDWLLRPLTKEWNSQATEGVRNALSLTRTLRFTRLADFQKLSEQDHQNLVTLLTCYLCRMPGNLETLPEILTLRYAALKLCRPNL
jgi:hypothetical protein